MQADNSQMIAHKRVCKCEQQKWMWMAILGFHRKPDGSMWTLHLSCITASFIVSMLFPLLSQPIYLLQLCFQSTTTQPPVTGWWTSLHVFYPWLFKNPTPALCSLVTSSVCLDDVEPKAHRDSKCHRSHGLSVSVWLQRDGHIAVRFYFYTSIT